MKKFYLLTILTVAAVSFAFSQDVQKITYGVHAGINISNMTDKDNGTSINYAAKVGFTGGVDVAFPIANNFAIQPELNYSQLGAKISAAQFGAPTGLKATTNFLALPVLVKYTLQNTGLGFYLGPQYGYLLSSSGKNEGVSRSLSSLFRNSDFSAVAGVEYYFPCGFGVSARSQLGLSNIVKASVEDKGETYKNNAITFTVGYRF